MTNEQRHLPLSFLVLTTFLCGGLIMIIEVMGSRVIGPLFGVGIFVWSSLIAVTMIALALGYSVGGRLSDRFPSPNLLYALIALGGLFTLLVPVLKGVVLQACLAFGLRLGSFVSSLLLFGPALFTLGCVSPYVIRLAARELQQLGKTVGTFYALSTVGSVVGTIVAGFFLIAVMSVNQIFYLVGAMLLFLALTYFVVWRKAYMAAALVLLLWPLYPAEQLVEKLLPNGTTVRQVHKEDSYYGSVQVVEYSYGQKRTRELLIDGLIQGGIDMVGGESLYPYAYTLGWAPQVIRPGGENCLVIGLGAGIIPRFYESSGVKVDVIDIDPKIVDIAENYFGFRTSGEVFIEDARYFLTTHPTRYDYLVLDVFNGDTTPAHLLSVEAFDLMRSRLSAEGVLAINLIGGVWEDNYMTASVVNTLKQVFDQVDLYTTFGEDAAWGNISIFAYGGEPFVPDATGFVRGRVHPLAVKSVAGLHRNKYQFKDEVKWIELRDSYNPIDVFDIDLKEKLRESILRDTDWDILSS